MDEPRVCYCGGGIEGHLPGHPMWPKIAVVRLIQVARCRGCGARMVWWETVAGKQSPHDMDGTSHFATCPVAGRFRKEKPSGAPANVSRDTSEGEDQ